MVSFKRLFNKYHFVFNHLIYKCRSYIYDVHKEVRMGGGGSRNFGQFCGWMRIALGEGRGVFLTLSIFTLTNKKSDATIALVVLMIFEIFCCFFNKYRGFLELKIFSFKSCYFLRSDTTKYTAIVIRSSHLELFCEKDVLKSFTNSQENTFLKACKFTKLQNRCFFFEILKMFKNTYFVEHLWTAATELTNWGWKYLDLDLKELFQVKFVYSFTEAVYLFVSLLFFHFFFLVTSWIKKK